MIDEATKQEALAIRETGTALLQFEVFDDESADDAKTLITDLKRRRKSIEDKRKQLTKPILDSKRAIDSFFKEAMVPLDTAVKHLTGQQLSYHQLQVQIANEAAAKLAESVADVEVEVPVAELVALTQEAFKAPTATNIRKGPWQIEVTDIEKVPREFMVVAVTALRVHAKDTNGADVPGIKFFREDVVHG